MSFRRRFHLSIPVSVEHSPSGALIYDLGENFSGTIRVRLRGKRGQQITFRHAEILMNGALFIEPLRSAERRAVYICADGEQCYSPRLTCMGFRYVGWSCRGCAYRVNSR